MAGQDNKARVLSLPARNCIYYRKGFCVRQEMLNPGLDPGTRCRVLTILESNFDHLLQQAENFELTREQVYSLWRQRMGESVSWESYCALYEPCSMEDDRCAFLLGNACYRMFPGCPGICRFYVVYRAKKNVES
ncbi:MAG: hypothetical protein ACOCV7_00415 [Desulfonatronovibrionaceae bacterium]